MISSPDFPWTMSRSSSNSSKIRLIGDPRRCEPAGLRARPKKATWGLIINNKRPLSKSTTVVPPWRREPPFIPRSGYCPACTRTALKPAVRPFTQMRLSHEDAPLQPFLDRNREVSGGFAGSRPFQSATTLALGRRGRLTPSHPSPAADRKGRTRAAPDRANDPPSASLPASGRAAV